MYWGRSGPVEDFLEYVQSSDFSLEELLRRRQRDFRWIGPPRSFISEEVFGNRITPYVAVDCEMVQTTRYSNAPARVSIVNEFGMVLLDTYIRPPDRVVNYRTRWSGVSRKILDQAERDGDLMDEEDALETVRDIVYRSVIVGHSVQNDMNSLELNNDYPTVDTRNLDRFGNKTNLRRLMWDYFGIEIQNSDFGHDSVEDARASMLLFRTFKREYTRG